MELKPGTKCALKQLISKDSDEGVLGKIVGYASELGGRVKFSTPHGTIIEAGLLWLKPLTEREKIKLEGLEADAINKNGYLYDTKPSTSIKTTNMKHYEEIKKQIAEMEADVQKFYGGNNAAGTRVRKALQGVKKACNDMRNDVQEIRESRK